MNNNWQRQQSSLALADDHLLWKTETKVSPFMQHSMCADLKPEPSKDAKNIDFDTDQNNHVLDLSGERCEHHIKESNFVNENAFRSLLPVNSA